MKRLVPLALILLLAGAGLYMAQRRQAQDSVSANAVVDVAADLQRDVSRVPMRISRISDADEIRIGNELIERYGYLDPNSASPLGPLQDYVSEVGARVAAKAHRRLPYRFHLDPNPDLINAFALPGGHVFVGPGLINQMSSEDELAFVLSHEIEHIDHYHAVERVQIEAQLRKVSLDAFAALAQIPLSLWQAGYSKDEEFEADREGLRLAASAGYSPRGAIDLLTRFVQLDREFVIHAKTPTGELTQLAIEGLVGYFRSHPKSSERLAQAKSLIIEDQLPLDQSITPLRTRAQSKPKFGT
jgi:predicted Zn-dependent protease